MASVHSSDFIGRDPIPKLLLRFATPAVISTFINCLYNIVDRLYIGRGVGANAQAGLSLTFPIMIILMAFGMMVGQGSSAVVSLLLGKKDVELLSSLSAELSTQFHMYPDRDAPGERLFLQLRDVLPSLEHHQLPQGCKDFSEYYLQTKR